MELVVSPPGRLERGDRAWRCVLGRASIVTDKREGDGGTPAGVFPLRRVLYRADRLQRPLTGLPVEEIATDQGWCDDPAHCDYNCPVRLPFSASHEKLWREDGLYDLVVILGHNDSPPIPGKGSAIFMHVARADFGPTEGCVALALADLLEVLADCRPGDSIHIMSAERARAPRK